MSVENSVEKLDQLRNDVNKLKEFFVDTINYAIDKDLVHSLYTLLMFENFHRKLGIYKINMNELITENDEKKKTSALFELFKLIDMLGKILKDIKLELSYMEIRKKFDLNLLYVETYKDMTSRKKIDHMMVLIQHGLRWF